MNQLMSWDEAEAARNRALGPSTVRMYPTSSATEWRPDEWQRYTTRIQQVAIRHGLAFPVDQGGYTRGSFTEVMLWRGETVHDRVAVLLCGVLVGWVPEGERDRVVRRLRYVGPAGTMRVFAPATLWVLAGGDWGLTVEA